MLSQLRIRLPEEVRVKVTTAAKANGTSVAAEVTRRVERTFQQDAEVGGQLRELTRIWQAHFLRGLGVGARVMGLADDRPPEELMADPVAFRTGVQLANDALMGLAPLPQTAEAVELVARLGGRRLMAAPAKGSTGGDK